MKTQKFWPLDFDPECEIYEQLSWDLPGYRNSRRPAKKTKPSSRSLPAARKH